jgi:hypothetical protein
MLSRFYQTLSRFYKKLYKLDSQYAKSYSRRAA